MKYNATLLAVAIAASSTALVVPAAQAATTVTFPMTTNGTVSNGGREYSVVVGSTTVKVRVTAWSTPSTAANALVQDGSLGVYSPNGLGVTNDGESGSSPGHTIDNQGNKDFVVFQFDQPVELISGNFKTYSLASGKYDSDVTVAYGTTNIDWQSSLGLNNGTYAQLSNMFGNSFNTVAGAAKTSSTTTTKLLNTAGNVGNIWLVGAAFNNPADCGKKNKEICFDGFKLSQLVVETAVPEPSTWMMMILGFGFIGMSLRRRRQAVGIGQALSAA